MKHAVLINGRRIGYEHNEADTGLPLVLLHGFCEDSTLWDPVAGELRDIQVVRIDLPGFGASDPPLSPGMETYADAVCAVLNELSIDRCVLIGHSMGGYTTLAFAEKYAERLAGFGLFHSHPYQDTEEAKENRRRGIAMLQSGKRDLYVTQLFPGLFASEFAASQPGVVAQLIEQGKRQSAEGIVAALEGMIDRRDHQNTLGSAACPVLFLLGSEDPIATPARVLAASMLANTADVHVLQGVGHMAMFEAPEKTVDIVRQFWDFCTRQ